MSERINQVFSNIYRRYDSMNHLFSFGIDRQWRDIAARETVLRKKSYDVLDVGAGTGDLSIAIYDAACASGKKARVEGIDMNKHMLRMGDEKLKRLGKHGIALKIGDALNTRYRKESFDVVASAFVLRNVDSLDKFVKETNRVLKKNGKFVHVEVAKPDSAAGRAFFFFYLKMIVALGSLVRKGSYMWLVQSIWDFDKKKLVKTIKANGFRDVKIRSLRAGIAFLVTGIKMRGVS